MLVFLCMMTRHPSGMMGVASKSKGLLKYSQDKMIGLRVACWKILRISSDCSRRRSHRYFGKALSMPTRIARKWYLKVRMVRSAVLRQCKSRGMSW